MTNPDVESIPEEILLDWSKSEKVKVMLNSNRTKDGTQILNAAHLDQLRKHLGKIHAKFSKLYGHDLQDAKFAMEVEYKITRDGVLAIKQARPWVFAAKREDGK